MDGNEGRPSDERGVLKRQKRSDSIDSHFEIACSDIAVPEASEKIVENGSAGIAFPIDYDTFVITADMMDQIVYASKTGIVRCDWSQFRHALIAKVYQELEAKYNELGFVGPITEDFYGRRRDIIHQLLTFDAEPPFTIQRLTELLLQHHQQYRSTHKFMNSICRLIYVTSTCPVVAGTIASVQEPSPFSCSSSSTPLV